MKTIQLFFLFLALSATTFYSCSDDNPIKNETAVAQKSIALRTALSEINSANQNNTVTNPFCFDFVYPVTFSYNNGTMITVATFAGLVDLIGNESPTFYMEGIVFPFQVIKSGQITTINSESEFTVLLTACGFDSYNDDLVNTFCFDFVFPILFAYGGDMLFEINSQQELVDHINQYGNGVGASELIFPVSVNYQGQIKVIHNVYELYQMIGNCDQCEVCTNEYAPVCVQTPIGIIEFGNQCYALCEGYTANDFVQCNPTVHCDISNPQVTVGDCNAIGNYKLTLNFEYSNPEGETFIVRSSGGVYIGTYALSQLPLTIDNYPFTTGITDYLHIDIGVNCAESVTWTVPNCAGCNCGSEEDMVCVISPNNEFITFVNPCRAACFGYTPNDFVNCGIVGPSNFGTRLGTCFNLQYPIEVQTQSGIVLVQNDSELLQYWFPAVSPIPNIIYPITATFGNTTYTLGNQAQFQAQIALSCN